MAGEQAADFDLDDSAVDEIATLAADVEYPRGCRCPEGFDEPSCGWCRVYERTLARIEQELEEQRCHARRK